MWAIRDHKAELKETLRPYHVDGGQGKCQALSIWTGACPVHLQDERWACIATDIALQLPGMCSALSTLLLTPVTDLCLFARPLSGQHLHHSQAAL